MSPLLLRLKNHAWWFVAFIWFLAWHLVITRQVWADPLRRVPGPIGDNTVMLWNLGWVKYALGHGEAGFWFTNAYYPHGFLFLYGTHTWLDGVMYWLASPLLPRGYEGAILWANIMMTVATVGSGLSLISGLRAWGIRHWPLLLLCVSGAVFSWFRMFALTGHYHFFGTQYMLLSLCLLSWARASLTETSGSSRTSSDLAAWLTVCAGLVLGVTFLNDQTMAVFAGLLGGLIIISMAASRKFFRWRKLAETACLYYGFSLVTASIHLFPIIRSAVRGESRFVVDKSILRLVDATSFVLPPAPHALGAVLQPFRDAYGFSWAEGTYLGVIPIVLLMFSTVASVRWVIQRRRETYVSTCIYATAAAWMFLVMGLGDKVMAGGHQYFTGPGRILKELPVINNIRLPQRWVWPAHLCIALAGASALSATLGVFKTGCVRRRRIVATILLGFAALPPLEAISYPPVPPVDFRNDPFLRPPGIIEAVQSRYTGGGVLMMPLEIAYAHGNVFQFLWGYDIPLTVSYTARMPIIIQEKPWRDRVWTPDSARWLHDKDVRMVVFPFHPGRIDEYQPWIKAARQAIPGLLVLNRNGEEI